MFIPESELNNRKPNIDRLKSSIYYLDDRTLAIKFINLSILEKDHILWKYEYSFGIKPLEPVILPSDILETEDGFCGLIEDRVPIGIDKNIVSFSEYAVKNRLNITLNDITKYILAVCNAVELCHEKNIINPDMATNRNVLYNIETGKVYFIDYHDMQVKDIPSKINTPITGDPITSTSKYLENGLWNANIDLYTLAIRYFYYTTRVFLPDAIRHKPIDIILKHAGICDTEFADCIRALYNANINNKDIRNAIITLNNEYELSRYKNNKSRTFIKK